MLLAIDTATRQISLALSDGQRVLAEHTWRTSDYHTVELAPQTALMLRRAGLTPEALAGVAVALGPGSYTGLRIGLGLAKGLAFAHSLPLIGVPTFEIILRPQPPRAGRILALLQAGRGRVIAAPHHWDGQAWTADGPAQVREWAALAADLSGAVHLCGEWEAAPPEWLRALKGRATYDSPAHALRRAGYLAEIGWERLHQHRLDDPVTLAPLYAGQPDGMAA